jgi:hypothetical protein
MLGVMCVLVALVGGLRIWTHNGSSSTPAATQSGTLPSSTPTGLATPSDRPTATATVTPSPIPTSSAHHHHGSATPTASATSSPVTSPTGVASTPTKSAKPTPSKSSGSGSGSGTNLVVPTFGSYSYTTSGNEKTSLPGTTRSFPATTHVKIAAGGCGLTSTWQPVPQHTEIETLCPEGSNAVRLASDEQKISFFGASTDQKLICGSKAIIYSTSLKAGDTWTFVCKSSDTHATQHAHAIGFSTIEVGGKSVRALHVHVDITVTGGDSGTSTEDYWYAPSLGTLVRNTGGVNATSGGIHYQSTYSLQLNSTTPTG